MTGTAQPSHHAAGRLAFGEPGWPVVLVLQPLFEEANRTRAVLVQAMRRLALDGIASILPDLPGTGDDLLPTQEARLEDWRKAARDIARTSGACMTLAVRGGALIDDATGIGLHWRLAPETGDRLLRDMVRASALSSGMSASGMTEQARSSITMLAGNPVHPALFTALEAAAPTDTGRTRTVRLNEGPEPADLRAPAQPVWRRAEPGVDEALVDLIATDVPEWMRACGVR